MQKNNLNFFVGVDEVGRGSWAGPIVACSCWINPKDYNKLPKDINDSKKLTEKKRKEIYFKIRDKCLTGVSLSTSKEIESYGLIESNNLAILRSLFSLLACIKFKHKNSFYPEFTIYVDGNIVPNFDTFNKKVKTHLSLPSCQINSIIKGDQKVVSISLASIIAKVTRDIIMKNYDKKYPGYNFLKNYGYGTEQHRKSLEELGVCNIHRKNFKPISTIFSYKNI